MENNFDEIDVSNLYSAVSYYIRTHSWKVDDESEWEMLKALKELQKRMGKALDRV